MGMAELERLTASSRAQLHEALLNILQSQAAGPGVNLSMATRATMGKRGISQLESAKGTLDIAADLATLVLGRMRATLTELAEAHALKADALARASAAEALSANAVSQAEERVAAQNAELKAAKQAAEKAAADAHALTCDAESRAKEAMAMQSKALRELDELRAAAAASERARGESDARRQSLAEQLDRERSVLARLAAENLLFVKRLQQSELERARAERERTELQTRWREQTEEWFRRATDELQAQLLSDWGASHTVELELQALRDQMATAESKHEEHARAAHEAKSDLHSKLKAKETQLADATSQLLEAREHLGLLQADAKRREHDEATMRAQLEVARAQLHEAKSHESALRTTSEAARAEAARLEERAIRDEKVADALRASLREAEEKLRVTKAVSERARAEVAQEHGALLEAEAKLGVLTQDNKRLCERLDAAEQEKLVIMRSMTKSTTGVPAPVLPVA